MRDRLSIAEQSSSELKWILRTQQLNSIFNKFALSLLFYPWYFGRFGISSIGVDVAFCSVLFYFPESWICGGGDGDGAHISILCEAMPNIDWVSNGVAPSYWAVKSISICSMYSIAASYQFLNVVCLLFQRFSSSFFSSFHSCRVRFWMCVFIQIEEFIRCARERPTHSTQLRLALAGCFFEKTATDTATAWPILRSFVRSLAIHMVWCVPIFAFVVRIAPQLYACVQVWAMEMENIIHVCRVSGHGMGMGMQRLQALFQLRVEPPFEMRASELGFVWLPSYTTRRNARRMLLFPAIHLKWMFCNPFAFFAFTHISPNSIPYTWSISP